MNDKSNDADISGSEDPKALRAELAALQTEIANKQSDLHRLEALLAQAYRNKGEEKYRSVFETIDEGFALVELIRNEEGTVTDLIYRDANNAFSQFTGWKDAIGKSGAELMPHLEPTLLQLMQSVADTGKTYRREDYVADLNKWYDVHYSCIGPPRSNFIVAVFKDTTDRKQREQHQEFLLNFSDTLRTLPDEATIALTSITLLAQFLKLDRCYIAKASRQQNLAIIGPEYRREGLGLQPLPDKQVLTDFPDGLRQVEEQTLVVEDLRTNAILSDVDKRSLQAISLKAFVVASARKSGLDGIWALIASVTTARNWTKSEVELIENVAERTWAAIERVKAEKALRKSEERLQLAVGTARTVVWEWDESNGQIQATSNFEEIYGIKLADFTALRWDIIHFEDRDLHRLKVEQAIAGGTGYHSQFRIVKANREEPIWLDERAVVVRDQQSQTIKMVGASIDITELKNAEAALRKSETEEQRRKMEAEQQREIFRVSLRTLEEERHRISENLHNGIGQILYGAKLSLANLKHQDDKKSFDDAKKYTSKLLIDAIAETRRISHELMPTTLEQFGLRSALEDICRQLSHSKLQFTCAVTGPTTRLERYLELAIYRTTQELMTNIAKHAAATKGQANIAISNDVIKIVVRDNGIGMPAEGAQKPGIGLASIRSKVKLLNGSVNIDSAANSGTTVTVLIPGK